MRLDRHGERAIIRIGIVLYCLSRGVFGASGRGGIAMKIKEIHKGKPAARKAKKPADPLKGREKLKKDEEACALTEPVIVEGLCCCEEVYC